MLGPTGSKRRKRFLLVPILILALAGLYLTIGAQAVNATGAFELDGNAVSTTGNAGTGADDWDRVCREIVGSDCSTTATTQTTDPKSIARTWVDASAEERIFTGGGSKDAKDPQDDWLWKPATTVPDKDTIRHAFAARYSLPKSATTCPAPATEATCEVIFFGADRFANDGDAQMGFWFVQNAVSRTNTASNGGFKFTGHHKNGDLLLVSDFSNGGTTSTIKAYFWDTSCTGADASEKALQPNQCADANLRLKAKATNANCATSAATSNFCGIVNPHLASSASAETSPWPFTDKGGNVNKYDQGEFYEAGVNLSGLGIGTECFSTVIAETRSSDSISSVLKDVVDMPFGECGSSTATTPQTGAGGSIPATGLSIGTTARVAVRDQAVITVSGSTAAFDGKIKFFLCGPLALASTSLCDGTTGKVGVQIGDAAGETVSGSAGTATVNSVNATLTSAGRYCWRAEYGGDSAVGIPASSDSRSTECFTVNPVTPTLSTTASADVTLGNPITDTASLTGTAKQPGTGGLGGAETIAPGSINALATTQNPAGGTITFTVLGPDSCSASGLTVTGSPVTVSGDNASYGPVSATPTAIGKYTFVATYSGNSPNTNGAGPSSCPPAASDGDEEVIVSGVATLATAQKWLPNDTAHITGPAGTTLSGTVTFTLYNDGTCGTGTGTSQYSVTRNVVTDADASPAPTANDRYVSTTNTAFFVTVANDAVAWSWKVSYDDANLTDPADKCESTTPAFTLSD
jgi:hypothetical protein